MSFADYLLYDLESLFLWLLRGFIFFDYTGASIQFQYIFLCEAYASPWFSWVWPLDGDDMGYFKKALSSNIPIAHRTPPWADFFRENYTNLLWQEHWLAKFLANSRLYCPQNSMKTVI